MFRTCPCAASSPGGRNSTLRNLVTAAVMRTRRPGWWASFLIGFVATAVAVRLQGVLRDLWQIRTLPERVMEWLLLYLPLDLFERSLQQLGAQAKDIALAGTITGMATLLLLLGTSVVHAGWSSWRLLAIGPALWLVAMAIIQPVTGGGFFAVGLLQPPLLINAAYLMMFLSYASVLIAGRLLMRRPPVERARTMGERRALLTGLGGTLVALVVARFAGRAGSFLGSSLPLAAPPTSRATLQQTAQPGAPTAVHTQPTGVQTAVATPTVAATPLPAAERARTRNQDGSLTAAGRVNGTLAPAITPNTDF